MKGTIERGENMGRVASMILAVAFGFLSAAAYAAGPSLEQTLLFLEEKQFAGNTWKRDNRWRVNNDGTLTWDYLETNPRDDDSIRFFNESSIRIGDVEKITIKKRENKSTNETWPELRIACVQGIDCIRTSVKAVYASGKTDVRSYSGASWSLTEKTFSGNTEKKRLYKLKNALQHLFELQGHEVGFTDEFFIDDLFSGSN